MGRDYRQLLAWQRADDLAVEVYIATRDFPKDEIYGLRSQMRRSVVAVPANIAEGSGKRTARDHRASYDIAMGELNELEYYVHLTLRLEYTPAETANYLEALRAETARLLDGLLKMLDKQIAAQGTRA